MRIAASALIFGLIACQTAPAPTLPFYQLNDLTGAYTALYDRTLGMGSDARVAAFRAEIAPLFPGFFEPGRPGAPATQERLDARIARSFEVFPDIRQGYTSKAAHFAENLDPALDSFRLAFPDMAPIGDIYLINSLGEMDGGDREIDGRSYFVFGADVMAQAHSFDDETPFFHHELFHVYHRQFFTGCGDAMWCNLWQEGLAVYAASRLTPDATDGELLLNFPEPIRAAVDSHLAEAVCETRTRLDSTSEDATAALFSFQRLNQNLPPRFAYYVGYLVAHEAAGAHSLAELAHLSKEEARIVVEAALAALAPCA